MEKTKEQTFLFDARERFRRILVAEQDIRDAALEDIKFIYNVEEGQWPDSIRNEREKDNRPCLTSNKLRKFVAQVANRERDQRLAGRVRPVDDKADIQTAQIIEGIVRQIEYASKADEVYVDGGEKAIAGGFGYWRIITKEMDDSFDQEVFIEKIENQFSVYLDPRRNFGFIREGMTKSEFQELYPDSDVTEFAQSGSGDDMTLWYEDNKVFIAEYFYKERYDKTIAQCLNIATGMTEIVEMKDQITPEFLMQNGYQVIRQKTKKATKVKWAKISGTEILEEGVWVGNDIPIIEIVGDSVNVGGKQYKRSLVRDAKDSQRMYNYWLTHMTEIVALAPKAPFLVTPQEIKGFESNWNEANRKNFPYLLYNPQGNRVPQRQVPPQIPTGANLMLQVSAGDIQDTIGMYDASFGERSNERTGVAIRNRAARSDFGTYHFADNFRRAVIETTRQLIDIIPKIYDTERSIRILGEDMKTEGTVQINKTVVDSMGNPIVLNDLTTGKYDVVADIRMYSTRRQEAMEQLTTVMQGAPNLAPVLMPLMLSYSDMPGSEETIALIKQYLPQMMGSKEPTQTPPQGGQGGI
jgi:hypothetical protein